MNVPLLCKPSIVTAATILFVLAVACGKGNEIASYDCESIKPAIMDFSEEQKKKPSDNVILRISDDVFETERTETKLSCEGTVRLNSEHFVGLHNEKITYHVMKDDDGNISYGYQTPERDTY